MTKTTDLSELPPSAKYVYHVLANEDDGQLTRSELIEETDLPERTIDEALDPETGEQAIDRILRWVDENYDNGYTVDNYHSALRSWGRIMAPDTEHAGSDHVLPDRFDKVSLGNVEDDQPAPSPSEVLTWEDIVTIVEEGCFSMRAKVMVVTLWALGCRPMSEFWELTFGDVDDRGDHILIDIPEHTKTGSRTIRMDVGVPYLQKWLREDHPAHDTETGPDEGTPLWIKGTKNVQIEYRDLRHPGETNAVKDIEQSDWE